MGAGASSGATKAAISATLSKTSFAPAQASSVKFAYKFSKPSSSFSYKLSLKKGAKWQLVKGAKKKGTFKGEKKASIKSIFTEKPVRIGSYKLQLSCDKGSKTLSFRVVRAKSSSGGSDGGAPPAGIAPVDASLPVITGTAIQGQILETSNGTWESFSHGLYVPVAPLRLEARGLRRHLGSERRHLRTPSSRRSNTVRVVVTASNGHGSASATSSHFPASGTVQATPPVPPDITAGDSHTCASSPTARSAARAGTCMANSGTGRRTTDRPRYR